METQSLHVLSIELVRLNGKQIVRTAAGIAENALICGSQDYPFALPHHCFRLSILLCGCESFEEDRDHRSQTPGSAPPNSGTEKTQLGLPEEPWTGKGGAIEARLRAHHLSF